MSESFSEKQEKLKGIIRNLHKGSHVDDAKKEFLQIIKEVSPEEIASLETSLMNEGIGPEEIQKLCEVHVEVFESSLKKQKSQARLPGHPVHTFTLENIRVVKILKSAESLVKKLKKKHDVMTKNQFVEEFGQLKKMNLHYTRKENQLFPKLEEKGFSGPARVMWGKHDEIRALFKGIDDDMAKDDFSRLADDYKTLAAKIKKMIFMEEKILFPTALKKLDEQQWALIRQEEKEIGYAWVSPGNVWDPGVALNRSAEKTIRDQDDSTGKIRLDEGSLSPEQLNLMLKNLPFDVTYVDENDKVCYYTASSDRIFARSPAIIGRDVRNCHPHKSVHVVENIIASFREKKRDVAEFWIPLGDKFVHIRYFPIYDQAGNYKGVIEVSQEISGIKKLEGEKRLLDWK